MKCYLLLRNNVESGPFTLEELRTQQLTPADLVWIEGQSSVWKYPTEIVALQEAVAAAPPQETPQRRDVLYLSNGVFVALPAYQEPARESKTSIEETLERPPDAHQETRFAQPLEQLQERYPLRRVQPVARYATIFSNPHSLLCAGCVVAALLFSGLLLKDLVATYDAAWPGLAPAGLAHGIQPGEAAPEENMYQNALTTEVVPVDTTTMKPVTPELPKRNLKRLVRLQANDYRVGVSGGIKNLRMLVINRSAFILDKVLFELQYLKPNGTVLKTEHLIVKTIAPRSSKSLSLPATRHGVKVVYHITDIQSRLNSDVLLNL